MLCLNPERLDTQVVRADLTLYLGSRLMLEQEEGLKVCLSYFITQIKIQVIEIKIFY